MNVLILGTGNSIWTVDYIRYCILPFTKHVTLYMEHRLSKYNEFYQNNNIKCYQLGERSSKYFGKRYSSGLRYFIKQSAKKQLKKEKYDIIIVQYVTLWRVRLAIELKKYHKCKVVLTYWGSDLFRTGPRELRRIGNKLEDVDNVVCVSLNLLEKFKKVYCEYDPEKIRFIWFGSGIIDEIDKLYSTGNRKNQKECLKKELGIPLNKISIAIGYNGIPEQQHLQILAAFSKLPKYLLDGVFLIYQMTYGGTGDYQLQIIEKTKELGVGYKKFDTYLRDKDIAKIRIATDIFVNGQTTDALSSSVCENLYCGNVLLNAEWLHYPEFDRFGVEYIEFESFDELSDRLSEILSGEIKTEISSNRDKVMECCSWDRAKDEWGRILGGI